MIAISNDDTGISEDINVRFEVAKKIVERAADYGIPAADIVVDPLVMPIGAVNSAGRQVMELVRRLRTELEVNSTCGASRFVSRSESLSQILCKGLWFSMSS